MTTDPELVDELEDDPELVDGIEDDPELDVEPDDDVDAPEAWWAGVS